MFGDINVGCYLMCQLLYCGDPERMSEKFLPIMSDFFNGFFFFSVEAGRLKNV